MKPGPGENTLLPPFSPRQGASPEAPGLGLQAPGPPRLGRCLGAGRGADAQPGPRPRRRGLRSGSELGGPSGRTMDSGAEEYELNGDLRPGSPGSPDASVSVPPAPLWGPGRRPSSLGASLAAPRAPAGAGRLSAAPALQGEWGRRVGASPTSRPVGAPRGGPTLRPSLQVRGARAEVRPRPGQVLPTPTRAPPSPLPPTARASNFAPAFPPAPARRIPASGPPASSGQTVTSPHGVHSDRTIWCVLVGNLGPLWPRWHLYLQAPAAGAELACTREHSAQAGARQCFCPNIRACAFQASLSIVPGATSDDLLTLAVLSVSTPWGWSKDSSLSTV